MRSILAGAACLGLLAGCGASSRQLEAGRPAYDARSLPAYWIWHDAGGWHLRTTTSGEPQRFRGVIEPVEGEITDARPTRSDLGHVSAGPSRLEFDFRTSGYDDGVDWRVSSGCSRFTLNLNDEASANRVFLGERGTPPLAIPFVRCAVSSPAR
jgi:hypothetical protein